MKKFNSIKFLTIIIINFFIFSNSYSQIENKIIVKVGDSLVTSIDLQNDILTTLVINKQEINQTNIDKVKDFSLKNLISKAIKRSEIKKYATKDFNSKDLKDYIENISKNLNTNQAGLKEIFKQNSIDYQTFEESYKIELLWNTLIFSIYKNQINVNIMEIDNEIENLKENTSEEDLKKIKQNILNKRKEAQLTLFSRSHFSNLENSALINFQ